MNLFDWLIILSFFLLLYAYFLYPALLVLLAGIFEKPIKPDPDFFPDISILIAAHNEEKLIEGCVTSIFNQNYPINKISLLVGSDGSTDETNRILAELKLRYPEIQVHFFERIGKNKVMNDLSNKIFTDIIFYMDSDIRLQGNEILKLVEVISDENVGAVIAAMKSIGETGKSSGGYGELLYQKIERIFRINESKIKSTVNSLGAFYGIKSEYYSKLPDSKVADDYTPLINVMLKRKRVIFVNEAEVLEVRGKSNEDEFSRRIRASSSSMSSLFHGAKLLLPTYGWTSFFLWSHKILRWLAPIFLFIILISTFSSENKVIFYIILIFQIFLYFGALVGLLLEKLKINLTLFKIPTYALNMNAGFLLAIFRFFSNKTNAKWER